MLTAALPMLNLEEIATWPSVGRQFYEAAHLPVETFGSREADKTRDLLARHDLSISALAYYENNLHPDPVRREVIRTHLKCVIDTASALGVPYVGTFIGRDWTRTVAQNTADGYPANLAYSPELWEWMFDLGLYLNWDPSHLVWQGIDPLTTIAPYAHRIVHAQAKDVEIRQDRLNRYGIFGKAARQNPWDAGWWRYRVPGRGKSSGAPSSTLCTSTASPERCPWNMRIPSGAVEKSASKRG